MQIERHPDPIIDQIIDEAAHSVVERMTTLEIGQLLYPGATPKELAEVPQLIITEHLTRYTMDELEKGQFFEVLPGKYAFIMAKETKRRLERMKGNE